MSDWLDDDTLDDLGFTDKGDADGGDKREERSATEGPALKKDIEVHAVVLEELNEELNGEEGEPLDLSLILDVPIDIRVVLARVRKTIQEILEWKEGTIIELDKLAGEPVEVYAGGQLIAKGETVIMDDHFGVYITEIIPPVERLRTVGNKLRRMTKK